MKKFATLLLILSFLVLPFVSVQARSVYVHGYYRSNGTYVQPYIRSSPSHHNISFPKTTNNNYYTNSSGNKIHSPTWAPAAPLGSTAKCRDGTYSFSQHIRGTCSYHGGVMNWLY